MDSQEATPFATASVIPNEPSFHSKRDLVFPTLPVRGGSLLWRLWRCVPQSIRLTAYQLLIRLCVKIRPEPPALAWHTRTAQRLPLGLYAKFGSRLTEAEVLATMFVGANTTIPVPQVRDVVRDDKGQLIVIMTHLPGAPCRFNKLSSAEAELFEQDLRGWLYQLRSLVPPTQVVGSYTGTSCLILRLSMDNHNGPWDNIASFHQFMVTRCGEDEGHPEYVEYRRLVRERMFSKPYKLCFTHGDLLPHNFLMKDGRLTGMVDFECSGWFPEYWEVTGAAWSQAGEWRDMFTRMFPQYREELEIEEHLWEVLCPW
ncbi:hypothetical protein K474DRAFT_1218425 [Panus rudis PR-1116 ss-1]|nr:hypothetical protein K474DRAFT_1218425 [Panus rudis PR-1116 ss-1]